MRSDPSEARSDGNEMCVLTAADGEDAAFPLAILMLGNLIMMPVIVAAML